jgi:hypothetical protein
MASRRIVVEHKDGRRISISESDFDVTEANPFNHGATVHDYDVQSGQTALRASAAKPVDDWASLRKEGFRAVMLIDPETGNEVPLPKGYRP